MRKTTPLLVQLDGQSLGDVTVSIDESKITPELANLNKTATTISTTTSSSNTVLGTVADRLTAKNAADEDKSVAQSAVDVCTKLDTMQKTIVDDVVGDLQSADGKTTIFDCASATALSLVDDPNAPAADQVRIGAAVKRIRDVIGQPGDADTENTTIGLLKKIKANTEGTNTVSIQADQLATLATETTQAKLATEATLGTRASEATMATLGTEATLSTRASEATLALVSKDATTQSLKAIVGTANDAVGSNTVIGLLKGIAAKLQ